MPTDRLIALDGPLNGDFIDSYTAEARGYERIEWSASEDAYLHIGTADAVEAEIAELALSEAPEAPPTFVVSG